MIKIILLILLLAAPVSGAEILVKAYDHHTVNADTTGWTHNQKLARQKAKEKGCPVVVMPDGHIWGSAEGLPSYIIVKLPGISVDSLRTYLQPITDQTDDNYILLQRAYKIPKVWVDQVISMGGIITINVSNLKGNIVKRRRNNLDIKGKEK